MQLSNMLGTPEKPGAACMLRSLPSVTAIRRIRECYDEIGLLLRACSFSGWATLGSDVPSSEFVTYARGLDAMRSLPWEHRASTRCKHVQRPAYPLELHRCASWEDLLLMPPSSNHDWRTRNRGLISAAKAPLAGCQHCERGPSSCELF